MAEVIDQKVAELTELIPVTSLERMNYRLSDAIRDGCTVTDKAENWTDGNGGMCAMSAAVIAARARGFMS